MDADRFNVFLHGSLDAMFCFASTSSGSAGFRIVDANQPGSDLISLPRESLLGNTLTDVLSEPNANAISECLIQTAKGNQAQEFEIALEADRDVRKIRLQVIPLDGQMVVKAYDVTAARRDQEALRDSEQYLSSVIANAPIIMYELDKDGVFKLSAGSSLKQIGLKAGEAVGASIYDFFPPDSQEVAAFRRALMGETVSTETKLEDGYFASRYSPRRDDRGEIVGILGVSYDVTEQKRAEQQLQQAQRMEAVGQLTGGIAHDFNNLLAVILGNLDLLDHKQALDPDAQNLVDNAINATQRGAELTQRLLAFSRRQLLEPRALDINELVASMLEMLQHVIPENIEIVFDPGGGLWSTHIDSAQLENAILNLCVNARDAMPTGGELRISTENLAVESPRAVGLGIASGDYVVISVADTGVGMAAEVSKKIFEPFFTTKDTGKGSGLGLSMVHGFVRQSGGGVDVDSVLGEGTTIRLYIPRTSEETATEARSDVVEPTMATGKGELVLVVEDDDALRRFVTDALAALNYRTLEAGDGNAALNLLRQHADIDLMFSDIVLPGDLNGLALYKRALSLRPDMKAILTTGYLGDEGQLDPLEVARVPHISKPYRVADLAVRFRQALDLS